MSISLGCIADDFTGASDLALMLAERGMATTQVLDMSGNIEAGASQAIVVALKSRTSPVEDAVRDSVAAARWLLGNGARQLLFKYCSTFDSTPVGNIGPVTESLLSLVGEDITVVCPAFPDNGRTVRDGKLYVNGVPLAESPMRDHPLTPMRESSLLKLMDAQTSAGASGLIPLETVRTGSDAISKAISKLQGEGRRYAITDIESNADLEAVGEACRDLRLVTGAAGIATGLAPNFTQGNQELVSACESLPGLPGHPLIISGSCSPATREQVKVMRASHFSLEVSPLELASGNQNAQTISKEAATAWREGPVMIFAGSEPDKVAEAQSVLGRERAATMVETTLAEVAIRLASEGCCKFIVAGGETSGAVAKALRIRTLRTGPRIDAGVPWMIRAEGQNQVLAFKSGNFGARSFFLDAMKMLP